ncbi:MAG: permease-like cell division protein FtsX [Candidatus Doudnabacteria bacterium]|nr:permease-like cell division protein FtsX [Candidatus Doudnabacteria bacterium]
MALVTTKRLIKSGFTNFFRNIWLSLAATSIMTITLFIISTILVLYTLTNLSIENIKDKVGITAYFNNQTSEREILNIKAEIELMDNVENVEYIPKTVARDIFMEIHKNEPLLLETINEFKDSENPLPNSFAIRANNLEDYKTISESLESDRYTPYFDRIRDNSKVIDRLFTITSTIKNLGIILTAIFIIVTIMVMFNTIRLTIYNRRQEVEIMRLVGATNWYIRMPFIIEGVMYGLIATVVTSGIMYLLLHLMSDRVESLLSLENIGGSLTNTLMLQIVTVNFTLGVGLGVIASFIAIRRYLKI